MITDQQRRWQSPLAIGTLAGFIFALISGSALLFFPLPADVRAYWSTVHWVVAGVMIVPYTIYQYRHYLRVRGYARQAHYSAGLFSFFAICGSAITGTLLIPQWGLALLRSAPVDVAHIFTSFVFTLLISAHLTLVASVTMMRARAVAGDASTSLIRLYFSLSAGLAIAAMIVAVALA